MATDTDDTDLPLDPGEYTVDEAKAAVEDGEFAPATLHAIEQAEREGKDRVTLTEWLADRHDYDPDAVTVDTDDGPDNADPSRIGARRETDAPTLGDDDYDPAEHHAWAPGEVPSPEDIPLVAVRPPNEGGHAGYWFENGAARVVRRNKRVDRAIVDGTLEYLGRMPNREDGDYL